MCVFVCVFRDRERLNRCIKKDHLPLLNVTKVPKANSINPRLSVFLILQHMVSVNC